MTAAVAVIVRQVPDEDYDEPVWVIECPHCGARDAIREVDEAVRWNRMQSVEFDAALPAGHLARVTWSAGGADFEHRCYECERCNGPVLLSIRSQDYQS